MKWDPIDFEDYENIVAYKANKEYVFLQYTNNKLVGFDDLDCSGLHEMYLDEMEEHFDLENIETINVDYYIHAYLDFMKG